MSECYSTMARRMTDKHYHKSPSRLPRIDTPPEHNEYRSNSDLRRSSYEIVPPVTLGRNDLLFHTSPRKHEGKPFYLPKGKKTVRYVEEPEILQGKTPSYSGSDFSSPKVVPQNQLIWKLDDLTHQYSPARQYITSEPNGRGKPVTEDVTPRYKPPTLQSPEHEELIFEGILREILQEETRQITKSFVREFAHSHLQRAAAYDIVMLLVDEVVTDLGPTLTDDAKYDTWVDQILDDVQDSYISETAKEIAIESIVEDQKELIDTYARQTVLDEMVLDCLLAKITSRGKAFTKEESADMLLDDLILTNLMEQYFVHAKGDKEV